MDQYAIFCLRHPVNLTADIKNPIGVAVLRDGKVTLTGSQRFLKEWEGYFQTRGWARNLETPEPFVTMISKTSIPNFVAYPKGQGKDQYEIALNALGTDVTNRQISPTNG